MSDTDSHCEEELVPGEVEEGEDQPHRWQLRRRVYALRNYSEWRALCAAMLASNFISLENYQRVHTHARGDCEIMACEFLLTEVLVATGTEEACKFALDYVDKTPTVAPHHSSPVSGRMTSPSGGVYTDTLQIVVPPPPSLSPGMVVSPTGDCPPGEDCPPSTIPVVDTGPPGAYTYMTEKVTEKTESLPDGSTVMRRNISRVSGTVAGSVRGGGGAAGDSGISTTSNPSRGQSPKSNGARSSHQQHLTGNVSSEIPTINAPRAQSSAHQVSLEHPTPARPRAGAFVTPPTCRSSPQPAANTAPLATSLTCVASQPPAITQSLATSPNVPDTASHRGTFSAGQQLNFATPPHDTRALQAHGAGLGTVGPPHASFLDYRQTNGAPPRQPPLETTAAFRQAPPPVRYPDQHTSALRPPSDRLSVLTKSLDETRLDGNSPVADSGAAPPGVGGSPADRNGTGSAGRYGAAPGSGDPPASCNGAAPDVGNFSPAPPANVIAQATNGGDGTSRYLGTDSRRPSETSGHEFRRGNASSRSPTASPTTSPSREPSEQERRQRHFSLTAQHDKLLAERADVDQKLATLYEEYARYGLPRPAHATLASHSRASLTGSRFSRQSSIASHLPLPQNNMDQPRNHTSPHQVHPSSPDQDGGHRHISHTGLVGNATQQATADLTPIVSGSKVLSGQLPSGRATSFYPGCHSYNLHQARTAAQPAAVRATSEEYDVKTTARLQIRGAHVCYAVKSHCCSSKPYVFEEDHWVVAFYINTGDGDCMYDEVFADNVPPNTLFFRVPQSPMGHNVHGVRAYLQPYCYAPQYKPNPGTILRTLRKVSFVYE